MVSVWGFHNFPVRQVMWFALILLCKIEEIFSYQQYLILCVF